MEDLRLQAVITSAATTAKSAEMHSLTANLIVALVFDGVKGRRRISRDMPMLSISVTYCALSGIRQALSTWCHDTKAKTGLY